MLKCSSNTTRLLQRFLVDPILRCQGGEQEPDACKCSHKREHHLEAIHIPVNDGWYDFGWEERSDLGGACEDDGRRVDGRCSFGEAFEQRVDEGSLCGGVAESSADNLEP
jgi:hypothetical protein